MGNSKSNPKQSMSSAQLLVNGYIRIQIEPLLTDLIVPETILVLCWMYYDFNHRTLIFCLNWGANNKNPLYFTYNGSTAGAWYATFWVQDWKINNNMGICSTTGLRMYPKVFSKYNDIWANITIFVCGHGVSGSGYEHGHVEQGYSYTHQCYCGIFVDTNILANSENEKKFTSDRWELPHLPLYKLSRNTLSFSSKHQFLFSIGGEYRINRAIINVSKLYCLDFNEDINNIATWQWKALHCKIGDRRNASSVILEKYDKLFICGGKNSQKCLKTVSIYDIENNRIKTGANCEFATAFSGIVNNQYKTDEIYLGGGTMTGDEVNDYGKTMQCYNAVKNKWNVLPNMELKYTLNPVLWLEDGYKLYIATCEKDVNGCEVLDLRICKKWNIVQSKNTLIKDFFGMDKNTRADRCRLVTS